MTGAGVAVTIRQLATLVHRWLGAVLCLLFLLWFPSGFVMMYWGFPDVTPSDRLARAPAIDGSTIKLSPEAAAARAGVDAVAAVTLGTFDGRPVYRFASARGQTMVYADTGDLQASVSRDMVGRIASAWTGQPAAAAAVELMDDVDQWTLQVSLPNVKPLWKYSWADGQELYVSEATGDVVQYTTTTSRWGAYVGAIPHWLYFAPLRRHGQQWSQLVIWTSAVATGTALLGLIVGVWAYLPLLRSHPPGAPSVFPYRGWKRWHTVVGLVFGTGAVTWAFSGMLSMEPFPFQAVLQTSGDQARVSGEDFQQSLRGRVPLSAYDVKPPSAALAELQGLAVKELELIAFRDQPVYIATIAPGDTRLVPVDGAPRREFDRGVIMQAATEVLIPYGTTTVGVLSQYDRYYLDRRGQLPLPVILVQLGNADRTRFYLDPKTARVVGGYDARAWANRWLYHGLHSLDFPWLYNHRPAWDLVVIAFMVGGTALSVTSCMLAWQLLGRKVRGTRARMDLARVSRLTH